MTDARRRRVRFAYQLNHLRWTLQTGGPFLVMVFVHPLVAVILAPIATYFVPPVLTHRSRFRKARALVATLGSVNLLMLNGITIFVGTIYCSAFFPAFRLYCVPAALLMTLIYILWIALTQHPAKEQINLRQLITGLFPVDELGDSEHG